MKKDYSKINFSNSFGLNFPNIIPYFIDLLISIFIYLIFKNIYIFFISMGLFMFLFGLDIGGYLLNKYCTNKDVNKCKNCKCWNCKKKYE